jgi:hypothetical protein
MSLRHSSSRVSESPASLLAMQWRLMDTAALRMYLQRLVLAEHRGRKAQRSGGRLYQLRRRRKEVAHLFVEQGGRVSQCVLDGILPAPMRWPGVVHLIETPGFDFELIATPNNRWRGP